MTLRIFNTLTKAKEPLAPIVPGEVKIYVCGPTVYGDPHIGHARSAVVFDVVARYLKARGHRVTLVRNLTDIDDKIVQKSRQLQQDYRIVGNRYIYRYRKAMERLKVAVPDSEPRATAFIPEMQDLIGKLIQKGHAYQTGGNVYYAVHTFQDYGRLSGRTHRNPAGGPGTAGQESTGPEAKRHPTDFALWKTAAPQEPCWPSPWGPGRPGWHIECSAMSATLLGEVFDIHGGGTDLIFPHHENEIAQSTGVFGKTPANCWMHHGLVNICGRKISKSLANSRNLTNLLELYPPGAIRLFLLSKRYRHPLEFSHRSLIAATRNFARLQRFFTLSPHGNAPPTTTGKRHGSLWFRFCSAMDDDLNFPQALSVIFEGVRHVNRHLGNVSQGRTLNDTDGLKFISAELFYMCREILGMDLDLAVYDTAPGQRNATSVFSPES